MTASAAYQTVGWSIFSFVGEALEILTRDLRGSLYTSVCDLFDPYAVACVQVQRMHTSRPLEKGPPD